MGAKLKWMILASVLLVTFVLPPRVNGGWFGEDDEDEGPDEDEDPEVEDRHGGVYQKERDEEEEVPEEDDHEGAPKKDEEVDPKEYDVDDIEQEPKQLDAVSDAPSAAPLVSTPRPPIGRPRGRATSESPWQPLPPTKTERPGLSPRSFPGDEDEGRPADKDVKPRGAGDDDEFPLMRGILRDYFSTPRHYITNPKGHDEAKKFINSEMQRAGLQIHTQEFESSVQYPAGQPISVTGANIIGILKGQRWGTSDDKIYVVGAHYDTTADTDGVDSNGSGVTGMLTLMRRLSKRLKDDKCQLRPHSIIFVAFDLQLREHSPSSMGLTGSGAFVKDYLGPKVVGSSVFKGAIILDSIMNWNDTKNSQNIDQGFNELFPSVHEYIQKSDHRGNFLLLIDEKRQKESMLGEDLARTWLKIIQDEASSGGGVGDGESGSSRPPIRAPLYHASIDATQTTSTVATAALLHFIQQDHVSFWNHYPTPEQHVHLPAVLLTDTGFWRGRYSAACRADWTCNTEEFITDKRLQFLKRTVDTLEQYLLQGECKKPPGGGASIPSVGISSHLLGCLLSFFAARFLLSL